MTFGKAFISCFVVMTAVEMPNGVEALQLKSQQSPAQSQPSTDLFTESFNSSPPKLPTGERELCERLIVDTFSKKFFETGLLYKKNKHGKKNEYMAMYQKYMEAEASGEGDKKKEALQEMAKSLDKKAKKERMKVAVPCCAYTTALCAKVGEYRLDLFRGAKNWILIAAVVYLLLAGLYCYKLKSLVCGGPSFGSLVEDESNVNE